MQAARGLAVRELKKISSAAESSASQSQACLPIRGQADRLSAHGSGSWLDDVAEPLAHVAPTLVPSNTRRFGPEGARRPIIGLSKQRGDGALAHFAAALAINAP